MHVVRNISVAMRNAQWSLEITEEGGEGRMEEKTDLVDSGRVGKEVGEEVGGRRGKE